MFITISAETGKALSLAATKELAQRTELEFSCTSRTLTTYIPDEVIQNFLLEQQRHHWNESHGIPVDA